MPKNVIILGMARSGTSLTASIFASHGYYVDEEEAITPKNHTNPKGLWESMGLLALNEKLLRATGFARDNTWRYQAITGEQVAALAKVEPGEEHRDFLRRFEAHAPWVWKDPRLCYTLANWWPLLDHDNTLVLLVLRDPAAIYSSFVRIGWREDSPAARAELNERTAQHIASARRIIAELGIPAITIRYEEYSETPDAIAARIGAAAGITLDAGELGYDGRFNHNNPKGKLGGRIDRIANMLPSSWVKAAKRLLPESLLRWLYPERYQ
jgi:hypothetical protein